MKLLLTLSLVIVILNNLAEATKVLLINDIHLDVNSTVLYSTPGTETSITTLQLVLNEAATEEAKTDDDVDAILLIGDMCKHHLAVEPGSATNQWNLMKYTMREAV